MQGMFSGATDFDASLGSWDVSQVMNMAGILSNTALTTFNYNDILFQRGKQLLQPNLTLDVSPTQYGGCEVNAGQGILGHSQLSKLPIPARKLMDGGMEPCAIEGSVSYTPMGPTPANAVVATLTLTSLGSVLTSGRAGNGLTFTKLYTENVSGEVVQFVDVNEANT
jgi:hypothetical protein